MIELMVSIAVLMLVLTFIVSFFGDVSRAWMLAGEKMDNFAKGRALINAIDRDLANAVIRQDLPSFPSGPSGTLAFYTRKFGQEEDAATKRPLTYVAYSMNGGTDGSEIVRTDMPYNFFDDEPSWKDMAAGSPNVQRPGAISRVLCREVFAFRYRFLHADGTSGTSYHDLRQANPTRAVSVSIIVLSDKAAQLVQSQGIGEQLRADLTNAIPANASSAKDAWEAALKSDALASKYPGPVLQGIRAYERITALSFSPLQVRQTSL